MIIDLTPDYNLFLNLLLVFFVIKSVVHIVVGLAQSEILKRDRYGSFDIIFGIIILLVVAWVVL